MMVEESQQAEQQRFLHSGKQGCIKQIRVVRETNSPGNVDEIPTLKADHYVAENRIQTKHYNQGHGR